MFKRAGELWSNGEAAATKLFIALLALCKALWLKDVMLLFTLLTAVKSRGNGLGRARRDKPKKFDLFSGILKCYIGKAF